MSSAVINVPKVPAMDTSMFTNNRSKLLKLAEGIKTKKKPSHNKKGINFKKEPGYANIEHLVFGTYRPKNSPNNLTFGTENRAYCNPNHSLISVNDSRDDNPVVLFDNKTSSATIIPPALFDESLSRDLIQLTVDTDSRCTEQSGSFSQANPVPKQSRVSSSSQSRNYPTTEVQVVKDLIENNHGGYHKDDDPLIEPTDSTLYSDFCSSLVKDKHQLDDHHYEVGHPAVVKTKSLDLSTAVHTPPSHLLNQSKFITQEFSADLHSPDMPAVTNKNMNSIKKLQVQGAVVTVAPSRLCSSTTQSSNRNKSRSASTSKPSASSIHRFSDASKDSDKVNMTSQRDRISNTSASVRISSSGKASGGFKRLSPARSSSIGITNSNFTTARPLNVDYCSGNKNPDSLVVTAGTTTCIGRRQSYLKSNSVSNDKLCIAPSTALCEQKSRVLSKTSISPPPLNKFSVVELDLRHQSAPKVSSKLPEVNSSSRLRKVSGIDSNAVAGEGDCNAYRLNSEILTAAHTNSSSPLQLDSRIFHNDMHSSFSQKSHNHSHSDSVVRVSSPETDRPISTSVKPMSKVLVSAGNSARTTPVKTISKESFNKTNSDQGVRSEIVSKKATPVRQKILAKTSLDQPRLGNATTKSNPSNQRLLPTGSKTITSPTASTKVLPRPRTTSAPISSANNLISRGRSSSSGSLAAGRKFGSASSSLAGSQVSLCSTTNIRAVTREGVKINEVNARRSFQASSASNRPIQLKSAVSNVGRIHNRSFSSANKPPVCPAKAPEKLKSNLANSQGKLPISSSTNKTNGVAKLSVTKEPIKRGKRQNDPMGNSVSKSAVEKSETNHDTTEILELDNLVKESNSLSLDSDSNLNTLSGNGKTVNSDDYDRYSAKATAESLDKLLADLATHIATDSEADSYVTNNDQYDNCIGDSMANELEKIGTITQVPTVPRRSVSLPGSSLWPSVYATNLSTPCTSVLVSPKLSASKRLVPARSISVTDPRCNIYNDLTVGVEPKDFAIPRQEFSQTSPSANVSRRSSSCSDKTKECHTCQSSSPEVNEITSSVPLKNSWFVVEDNDCIRKRESTTNCHQVADEQVKVSDLNGSSVVWTSPPIGFEDAESTAVGESVTVSDHHKKSGFKSTKDRNVPKCVRRVKAASSPSFCDSRTDFWVSEGDLRRPWSQICSEQDVERLAQARSCAIGSGSMLAGIDAIVQLHPSTNDLASESGSVSAVSSAPSSASSGSSHGNNFGSRFASMRTPSTHQPASSVEGVLQKFRKSFSARFYKKVKAESPPSTYNVSISPRHASFSSYLNDHLGSESLSTNESVGAGDTIIRNEPDTAENSTVFRLGPIVWRTSKEKKGKKLKKLSIGGESVVDDKIDIIETTNKDHLDLHTKSFTSNGSTITLINHRHPNGYPPGISVVSPRVFPRRAHSTSLRAERPKRPLSEQGSSHYGSVNLHDAKVSEANDNVSHISPMRSCPHRNGSSSSTTGLPPKILIRREKLPAAQWSRERTNLRRSISQPLEIERLGAASLSHSPLGLSDHEDHDLSSASSDEDFGSDNEFSCCRSRVHKNGQFYFEYSEPVMYAEALWDHVTLDSEELPFKAGDLIEVLDKSDSEWWWGIIGSQAGWFPASFVRIRVNQEDTVEDCFAKMENGTLLSPKSRKLSSGLLSSDQVRTKVIMEIFNTERDFVQHLKDVCEGYLKQVRKRPDMFSEERINVIFANIEQLYHFQSLFVSELEQCINWEDPHLSEIGSCFIKHKDGFEIYSEYCNNHPQAVNELQQLYSIPKYAHFFEACRLLQDMIDIALDGFLLTPVQKICKYPLQLGELLKYTKTDHPDYYNVEKALKTMKNVAQYINERKRRMECLEKLAAWQTEVEDWEGGDLLDLSSELIYSGDVYKVTTSWSRDFTLFLFDHQLIICKKDLLKRHSYTYKSRLCVDNCEIRDILDGKDVQSGLTLKNAWKVFCAERGKWYIFATRTPEEKSRWMKAFSDERRRVAEDRLNGFVVSDKAKKMAIMVVQNKKKPKKPKDKENKEFTRRMTRPEVYTLTSKSGSLPSNVVFSTNKKKTASGWFHFGSNKKTKR